jgi:hypothetical protein
MTACGDDPSPAAIVASANAEVALPDPNEKFGDKLGREKRPL